MRYRKGAMARDVRVVGLFALVADAVKETEQGGESKTGAQCAPVRRIVWPAKPCRSPAWRRAMRCRKGQ
ncbi:hypothetical protein BSLA_01r4885 [Burkholderia stabilis]|nr:hypothetical protein BSLA_01r4885 [Burkholderia stabilis]